MTAADSPAAEPKNAVQRRDEVAGRQPVQVQQRQHLSHLGALAAPRRQDHRAEPDPLAGHRVDPAVVHPRRAHRDRPGRGGHLALACVAVAHHQPPATLVPLGRVRGQVRRRPRPPRRRPASAGHPHARVGPGPGTARRQRGRWWLHSTCGVPSPPAFTAPALPGLVIREGTPRSHLQTRSTTSGHTSLLVCRGRSGQGCRGQ